MKKHLFLLLFGISYFSFLLPGQSLVTSSKPFTVGEVLTFASKELGENRQLNIYLPAAYEQDDTTHYPVIYLLDGSAEEDFLHIVGLVQFANYPWVNLLPPSIVVGIENVDRKRDFTFPTNNEKDKADFPTTGGSAKFIAFLEKEVQVVIQERYRTHSTRTLIGQSLGGLLATEVLFKKPALFSHYIIVSPSLWWDDQSLLAQSPQCLSDDYKSSTTILLAVGQEGEIMENDAIALAAKLQKKKSSSVKTFFQYMDDQDHANILHLAIYKAFESLRPHYPK